MLQQIAESFSLKQPAIRFYKLDSIPTYNLRDIDINLFSNKQFILYSESNNIHTKTVKLYIILIILYKFQYPSDVNFVIFKTMEIFEYRI